MAATVRRASSLPSFPSLAAALLVLSGVLAAAASAREDDAPPRPVVDRAARITKERELLDGELARLHAAAPPEDLEPRLVELRRNAGLPPYHGVWVDAKLGSLPLLEVDHWLQWQRPQRGSDVAGALDVTRKTHPFGAVVDLSRQLREKDVEFVFVVFPSRLNLYPELVVPEVEKPPNLGDLAAATTGFLRLLNENDVETVDLVPAFVAARTLPPPTGAPEEKVAPGQLYRGHDLHWAQRGAELGAEIVAARLRQMPWFKEGPLAPGAGFELEDVPDGGWHRVRWSPGMPARDARDSPIVVLGDSFVTQHDEEGSSFADHLARFTGWPTDVLAPLGGAELRCRQLLAGRGDDLKGKKVVIWLLSDGLLRIATGFRPIPIFGEKPEEPDAPSRPRREKKDGDR